MLSTPFRGRQSCIGRRQWWSRLPIGVLSRRDEQWGMLLSVPAYGRSSGNLDMRAPLALLRAENAKHRSAAGGPRACRLCG